jgi:DNA-binding MarR family transcriptional regulator
MTKSVCLCTSLRQAALAATALYDDILAPSGLKVTMFRLLRRIAAQSDISISQLARDVDLDRSTLGRNLRVLERQGLVTLAACADGRARAPRLSDKGAEALDRALPLWAEAQARMAELLGPDVEALQTTLHRLTDQRLRAKEPANAD